MRSFALCPAAIGLAALLSVFPAGAQTQRDAPIGAYPPGSGPGSGVGAYPPGGGPGSGIGAYPAQRPPQAVRPPDAPDRREPDAGEQILERQRALEEQRRRDEEIRRSLPNRS